MKNSVLITYIDNGDLKGKIEHRLMQKNLIEHFINEGKELNMEANFVFGSIATFTDGTEIISAPAQNLDEVLSKKDITEVYVSKSLQDMNFIPNISEIIKEKPSQAGYTANVHGIPLNVFEMQNNHIITTGVL